MADIIKKILLAPIQSLYGFLNMVKIKLDLKYIYKVVIIGSIFEFILGLVFNNPAIDFGYAIGGVLFLVAVYILQPNKLYERTIRSYIQGFKKYRADRVLETLETVKDKGKIMGKTLKDKVGEYIEVEKVEEDIKTIEQESVQEESNDINSTEEQTEQDTDSDW